MITNLTSRFPAISYIPFATAAVQKDKCEIDSQLLAHRVKVLAVVIFAAIAATTVAAAVGALSPFFIFPWLGLFALIKLDDWLTRRSIDEKAANEYLEKAKPSASATAWLQKSPRAVEMLINNKGDLNKPDEDGRRLLDLFINPLYVKDDNSFEIFKRLIDQGVDLNLTDSKNFSYIERIFQSANPHYLQYVVEKKKIPNNLTDPQKFNFWFYLGHHPISEQKVFQDLGLTYEIQDNEGLTPLTKLIQMDPRLNSKNFSRGMPMDEHIVYLIGNTEVLKNNVTIQGKQFSVRKFLQVHRNKSETIEKFWKQIEEKESKQTAKAT
jgi:hypothetical protein